MTGATLDGDTLARLVALHREGVQWRCSATGDVVASAPPGVLTSEILATVRPHRDAIVATVQVGRCAGCGIHAGPGLFVCYWCREIVSRITSQ